MSDGWSAKRRATHNRKHKKKPSKHIINLVVRGFKRDSLTMEEGCALVHDLTAQIRAELNKE